MFVSLFLFCISIHLHCFLDSTYKECHMTSVFLQTPSCPGLSFHFDNHFLCATKAFKCCDSWGRKESDTTEWLNWTELRPRLFIFAFLALGDWLKKIQLWFMPKNALPVFSSRSFTVSRFIFRTSNQLNFIFVWGMKECSNCTDLYAAAHLFQHRLLKRLSFPLWYILSSIAI